MLSKGKRRAAPLSGFLICWGVMLFGLVFCWFLFPQNFHLDRAIDDGESRRTSGEVRDARPSGYEINDIPVVEYTFVYQREGTGPEIEWKCYSTGLQWEPGETVEVEYAAGHPRAARIVGARQTPVGAWALSLFLLPAVAAGVLAYLFFRRHRVTRVLRYGVAGHAVVSAVERTLVKIDNRWVYRFRMRRDEGGSPFEFFVRRHRPEEVAYLRARHESGQPVPLLYDPRNPKRVIFPETL